MTRIAIVKNTGPDLDKIADTLMHFGAGYEYVITAYPPFLKHLRDRLDTLNFPWAPYRINAMVGGEGMTEALRDYLEERFGKVRSGYGASDITIAVLAPGAYGPLRRAGLPRMLAAASRGLLDYDGQALVLVAPPGCGPGGQVAMGRVLLRQWLTLSRRGYATHPLSQLLDYLPTRDALAQRLGIDDAGRLLSLFRVGRPVAPAARSYRRVSRRELPEVVDGPSSRLFSGRRPIDFGVSCRGGAVAAGQGTATVILPAARPSSMARCAATISSKLKTRTGLAW
jgi:hypothetical protein